MGLLGVFHLALVGARLGRHEGGPINIGDFAAYGSDGVFAQAHVVGTHISNESRFVETLGNSHHFSGAEAQLVAGFLLERAGNKRSLGRLAIWLFVDGANVEVVTCECCGEFVGTLFGDDRNPIPRHTFAVKISPGCHPHAIER